MVEYHAARDNCVAQVLRPCAATWAILPFSCKRLVLKGRLLWPPPAHRAQDQERHR